MQSPQGQVKPPAGPTPAWLQAVVCAGASVVLYILIYVGMNVLGFDMAGAGPVFLVALAIPVGVVIAFGWLLFYLVRRTSAPTMATAGVAPPPGWYMDPHGSGSQRWWNGTVWSDAVRVPPQ
jgi:hypothetical protein